ncbi:MAG: pyridoxamine 5'-phosphate oxidase family protein [Reichenbachiella sp.]|uniref:pyridoxamine 5'-phosphate oxidase family protein n=1 Tax=Reichenbachiella sp. TaxID=2184521 RepID=UPI0032640147
MLGKLTSDQIDNLLHSETIGRLGCHGGETTYIVPISYAFKHGSIYIHTIEGLKIELMRENPNIAFEVDRIRDMNNWQSVVIIGIYKELEGQEADEAIQILTRRFMPFNTSETVPSKYGMEKIHLDARSKATSVVFKIEVLEKSGRYEKS